MTGPEGSEGAAGAGHRPGSGDRPSDALPDESILIPAPDHDEGTIVPDQLPDAPAYIPPPMGMLPGSIMPPPEPGEVSHSAWITTAQTAPAGSRVGAIAVAVLGIVVVVVVVGFFLAGQLTNGDRGKVLFGTAAGPDLCSVGNPTNVIKTTDPVFFAAVLRHKMDAQQDITFRVTRDGNDFVSHVEPHDGTTSFDCYGNQQSLGALEPGTYVFQILHNGDVEASGTLTVQ